MGNKQLIHAWINPTTYLELKQNQLNISSTVDKCLTEYLKTENKESKELIELEEMMEKAKNKRKSAEEEMQLIAIRMARFKDERKKVTEELEERQDSAIETIKRNNLL